MANFKLNVNMSKKDIINAKTSSLKITPSDAILTVSGVAIVENGGTDIDGNCCDVGYIATDEGVFGFISNVMLRNLDLLGDYLTDCLNDGELCRIQFISGKTKEDTEFYSFRIVD